jgi:hypothetical protein
MPDNAIYYHMAYAAIVVLFAGYGASIWIRRARIARARAERERAP